MNYIRTRVFMEETCGEYCPIMGVRLVSISNYKIVNQATFHSHYMNRNTGYYHLDLRKRSLRIHCNVLILCTLNLKTSNLSAHGNWSGTCMYKCTRYYYVQCDFFFFITPWTRRDARESLECIVRFNFKSFQHYRTRHVIPAV